MPSRRILFLGALAVLLFVTVRFFSFLLLWPSPTSSTPGAGLDRFDGIVFINLASRKDRLTAVRAELERIGAPQHKIERVEAVKNDVGLLGCALSHIKAMDIARSRGWNSVLVLEDDVKFKEDAASIESSIEEFFEQAEMLGIDWDAVLLAGGNYRGTNSRVIGIQGSDKRLNVRRVFKAETTSAYAVKGRYVSVLQENLKASSKLCAKDCTVKAHALDQYWSRLQKKDDWFIFHPTLAKQASSYSDIEKKHIASNYHDS